MVFFEKILDFFLGRAVEYGRRDLPAELFTYERKVYFEYLSDVHSGRNAEGVKNYLKGRAVREERHIRFGEYSRNNALVSVTSRHLVADGNLSLLSDIYPYKFGNAGGKFILVGFRELLDVDYYTAFAVRNSDRSIFYFSRFLAENSPQKSLFGSEFGLALWRYFTYENISARNFRSDTDNTLFVEVF